MTLDLDAIQADIDRYGGTNREQGDALVAELRAARAFEQFIRNNIVDRHTRALTLVENWDRLVASGDAYPGSEEQP
jgi:hypothetical protein